MFVISMRRHSTALLRDALNSSFAPMGLLGGRSSRLLSSQGEGAGSQGSSGVKAPSMQEAVSEQRQMLFPNAERLQEAWQQQDAVRQTKSAAVPSEDWSPKKLPYKTYDKHSSPDDSEEDSDADEAAAAEEEVDGLQVGMEEVGFRYSGPEPTAFGDWAHKGRVTDF
eukprot:TRINITY_DN39575_c0_g1_i1.p1 TRINITY_DN39575_c0_g1~~TRINITY_DN39575_c0_g1_i1.p1  ORF type:complete len:167 (-),score=49.21 TRINITY_DN39575_c0_g1_i1:32-532(-)